MTLAMPASISCNQHSSAESLREACEAGLRPTAMIILDCPVSVDGGEASLPAHPRSWDRIAICG
jgi:hypothetical protein